MCRYRLVETQPSSESWKSECVAVGQATWQSLRSHKISYAYFMGRSLTNSQQVIMSDRQVDTRAKSAGQAVFSTTGKPPGSNHRKFGGNFLFCDGHTETSSSLAPFPLTLTNGEALLNP